jgi:hypothetical protein
MRRAANAIPGAVLLAALALAGCGGSGSASGISVPFKSAALVGGSLPARYTCDGKDISPPLEWGAVPSGVSQLAVFILGLTPNPSTGRYAISVEWALAGIDPALHRLAAGELPRGAHVGLAGDGERRYSICPARGKSKRYQFALYSVPAAITVPPRFTGLALLHAIADPASATATVVGGAFIATYKRR